GIYKRLTQNISQKMTRLAQRGEGFLDVIQVLHSLLQPAKHNLSVGSDLGVRQDGIGAVQVPKATEISPGPGVHDKAPGKNKMHLKQIHGNIKSLHLPNNYECWLSDNYFTIK
uniref:Uncharacterized protein n=1 Tax=Paramormyrops kingsleyae TaxID=1676925 RepID=A0A3B3RCY7_9TELE